MRGHVWYAATLLLFNVFATVRPCKRTFYTDRDLAFGLGLDVVVTYLVRLVCSIGVFFELLRLQPAYLQQYISAYLLGAFLDSAPTQFLS